jgi:hypothetical protein
LIAAAQLRRLLGFQTRMQANAFLKVHEIYDYTSADFDQAGISLRIGERMEVACFWSESSQNYRKCLHAVDSLVHRK